MNKILIGKNLKDNKLRHAECYGTQEKFDELYQQSKEVRNFKNLMKIEIFNVIKAVTLRQSIRLLLKALRN